MNHYLDHCTGQATDGSLVDVLCDHYGHRCPRADRCKRHLAFRALENDNLAPGEPVQMVDAKQCIANDCIQYL